MSNETRDQLLMALVQANRRYQQGTDVMDQAASELMGINRTDAHCLDILDMEGRLSAGRLAAAAGLSPGAVTAVLDRLERAGYARRVRDPDDRRRVLVEATERAREVAWDIYGPLGERGAPQLDPLSDDDLRVINRFLEMGAELQSRRAEELRSRLEREGPLNGAAPG